jgi:nitroreductase
MSTLHVNLDMFFARRSVRAFRQTAVPPELVDGLLHAAMAAPSAVCKDPWHFIIIREAATLVRIAEGLPNGKMLAAAPLGIVVCGSLEDAHDKQLSYLLQDCSAAIENILLAASALGLGACWLGVHPRQDRIDHLRAALSIPPGIMPIAGIAAGFAAEQPKPRTRYNPSRIHSERW